MKLLPWQQVSSFDVGSNYYSTSFSRVIGEFDQHFPPKGSSSEERERVRKGLEIGLEDETSGRSRGRSLSARVGGPLAAALGAYNLRGGACLERELPSSDTETRLFDGDASTNRGTIQQVINQVEQKTGMHAIFRPAVRKHESIQQTCMENLGWIPRSTVLPVPISAFSELALRKVDEEISRKCKHRVPFSGLLAPAYTPYEAPKPVVYRAINEAISADRPVGLTFDLSFVAKGMDESKPYVHASIIVRREWNSGTGKCEFLIRNSIGKDGCEPLKDQFKERCKDGSFWVDEDVLKSMSLEAAWLP